VSTTAPEAAGAGGVLCPACRAPLAPGSHSCTTCGQPLPRQALPKQPATSSGAATLLLILAASFMLLLVAVASAGFWWLSRSGATSDLGQVATGGPEEEGPSAPQTPRPGQTPGDGRTPVVIRSKPRPVSTLPAGGVKGAPPESLQPEPGEVLVEGDLDQTGGRLEVPGSVSVEFPAGALERRHKIVVRASKRPVADGGFFFIDIEGHKGSLARPARVSFEIPAGVNGDELRAFHQLDATCWMSVPGHYDAGTRTLTAEFSHFSGASWYNVTNLARLLGAAVGSIGTGVAVVLITGSASITWPVLLVVGVGGVLGAGAATPAADLYQKWGLTGYLPVIGFNIYWKPSALPSGPSRVIMLDGKGKVTCVYRAGLRDEQGNPLPLEVCYGDSSTPSEYTRIIPEPVYEMAGQLQYAKAWYRHAGYDMQPEITVLLRDDLAKLATGVMNPGEWDGRVLNLNVGLLTSRTAQNRLELRTTIPHEIWHAVYTHNGYGEHIAGLDDMMATTIESAVWPETRLFSDRYGWPACGEVLVNGLLRPGAKEGFTRTGDRGYALWPFG